MPETIVRMERVSKSFAGIKALNDVYLELYEGEVHALMGENGAGKSTLMKILTGVYSMDSGSIQIYDKAENKLVPVDIRGPLHAQQLGLSIVFQELNLLENMSIAENIFIGREPTKWLSALDRRQLNELAKKELEKVNLNLDPDTPVSSLSTGQKQCVEIAKALSFAARIVVFDEPTASLSEHESQALFRIIRDLKTQGVCVVYISHRIEEVLDLADRITVFRNGEFVRTVVNEAVSESDLICLMIGRQLDQARSDRKTTFMPEKSAMHVRNIRVFPDSVPIEFSLRKQEILGIFGLVGAGRTELSRILFGIDPTDTGEIYIDGGKVKISCPADAIKAGIGLVPEDRKNLGLLLDMSIGDNILIAKLGQDQEIVLKKKKNAAIVERYISDLSIALHTSSQAVKELSGGNQQKVVIAKWLAMGPDILILDEPTRGVDVGAKAEIYALLRRLADGGKTMIVISSEIAEILRISDRVLVLHEGSITADIPIDQANKNNIMEAAFGGLNHG